MCCPTLPCPPFIPLGKVFLLPPPPTAELGMETWSQDFISDGPNGIGPEIYLGYTNEHAVWTPVVPLRTSCPLSVVVVNKEDGVSPEMVRSPARMEERRAKRWRGPETEPEDVLVPIASSI